MQTKVSQTYKPTVRLTAHRGHYRVQSGTNPSVFYETSANSCNCPARKPYRHMKFVRSLNVSFYVKKAEEAPAAVPMTAGAPSGIKRPVMGQPVYRLDAAVEQAERRLTASYRALADTSAEEDSYASLLRQVDEAERAVAALNYDEMRALV